MNGFILRSPFDEEIQRRRHPYGGSSGFDRIAEAGRPAAIRGGTPANQHKPSQDGQAPASSPCRLAGIVHSPLCSSSSSRLARQDSTVCSGRLAVKQLCDCQPDEL